MVVGEFEVEDGCGFVFGPTLRVRLRLTLKGNVGLRAYRSRNGVKCANIYRLD